MLETVIKRHSKLGIAATIIGGGLPLLLTSLMILSFVLSVDYNYRSDFVHTLAHIIQTAMLIVALCALPLHLTGLIFALVGFFSKKTKNSFPIAGIILNVMFGLIGVGIAVLASYALLNISAH